VSRRQIPFLFLLYVAAYLDRINVGFTDPSTSPQVRTNSSGCTVRTPSSLDAPSKDDRFVSVAPQLHSPVLN
jgi:hypothetical protein